MSLCCCVCAAVPRAGPRNMRVFEPTTSTLTLSWDHAEGPVRQYKISYAPMTGDPITEFVSTPLKNVYKPSMLNILNVEISSNSPAGGTRCWMQNSDIKLCSVNKKLNTLSVYHLCSSPVCEQRVIYVLFKFKLVRRLFLVHLLLKSHVFTSWRFWGKDLVCCL